MTGLDDLAAFVAARLDDDERYVRAVKAAGERLKANPDPRMTELGKAGADAFLDNWDDLGEFARWKCAVPADLDRQLREVAAKRAIMDEHPREPLDGDGGSVCDRCADWTEPARTDEDRRMSWPCSTVRHLATTWSDHPDYRQEWKP